jgi:IS5 family transposase
MASNRCGTRKRGVVLVTKNPDQSLWESILPECCLEMPPELARVDALLDDAAFFEPYRSHFDPEHGRRSTPIETYLRMMFLKSRYKLSYEVLCREVADSISWRRFCHIPLGAPVPHPTTLMKITTRCGEATIGKLNQALLEKAAKDKVLRTDKVRADTTVVEANVAYPTDSGLLAKAVARMARLVERIHAAGGATRTKVRDRRRAAGRRVRNISANLKLRNDDAKEKVRQINAELATLAETAAGEALAVARNARRKLARCGDDAPKKLAALVAELETTMALTATIVAQTRTRLGGVTPAGATRVVSLHDPDARPIAKGRLGKPVEFGYKAQVVDNADGVVLDHRVVVGNPPDAPMLAPAVARVKALVGRAPRAVTADGIYGEASVEDELKAMGVKTVVIPRKGKPNAARRQVQARRSFRKLVKWRTGCEGRISHLKHGYGWNRTLLDGIGGAETWCGLGVLFHNSVKISALLDAKASPAPGPSVTTPPEREATGPPPRGKPPASLFA